MKALTIVLLFSFLLCGCKTLTVLSTVNPAYRKCLEEGRKPPDDLEKWIPEKKMEADGIGKIEADFKKDTIKRDSGLELKTPNLKVDVDEL